MQMGLGWNCPDRVPRVTIYPLGEVALAVVRASLAGI